MKNENSCINVPIQNNWDSFNFSDLRVKTIFFQAESLI
jgi:hypothetical protein